MRPVLSGLALLTFQAPSYLFITRGMKGVVMKTLHVQPIFNDGYIPLLIFIFNGK